jgi:hypothetical protein
MRDQSCWICWVGLDIDDINVVEHGDRILLALGPGWSLRTSHSGNGLHAIARVGTPIFCHHSQSGSVVKQVTKNYVDILESIGVSVCKADCRVFWLVGGAQQWWQQSGEFLKTGIVAPASPRESLSVPTVDLSGLKPGIAEWVERFLRAGVIRSLQPHQTCYLRDAVEVIQAAGENVQTRSSLRPKSGGFIDLTADSIQLWAHADGGVIWSYEEPEL